jgi:peptidoglycan/LPS O-acetylase OafA/YrhL
LRRWGTAPAISLREFYALRAARILPCLLLVLGLLSVMHLLGLPDFAINPERASLGRALAAAFGLHVNWLEGRHGYLPGGWDVLWSLSIEEAFYLGFPLACVALRKEGWLVLPLLGLIAIGPVNRMLTAGQTPWEDYAYLSCLDGIAFGCLAALAAARLRLSDGVRVGCALAGGAAVVLVMGFRSWVVAIGLVEWGLNVSLLQFGVALLLLGQIPERAGRSVHRITRPLQGIGRCSYEIYLSHMFVVTWAIQSFASLRLGSGWFGTWYTLELLASLAIGAALARLYSAPLNRALRARWLTRRHSDGPVLTAESARETFRR